MNIELYFNTSENNAIGKLLISKGNVNAVLKDDNNILSPTVILTTNSSLEEVNYIKIPTFNRCYFVDGVMPLTGSRYELVCRVDVLETYKDEILNLNCIVDKQEDFSIGSKVFDDGSYEALVRTYTETRMFPNGLPKDAEYILVTAG